MQNAFPTTDWFVYNNHKIIAREDPNSIDCRNSWDINFLVTVLQKSFPDSSEGNIKETIDRCQQHFSVPINRDLFVRCVMEAMESKE